VLGGWLQGNRRSAERFLRESQLAAELDHPNVVTVYDAGETDGRLWIAMQFIDGEDLSDRIDRTGGPLALEDTLAILDQVAGALDAAHQLGLVHRDVKPSNVLLQGDHAYLTDFGLMRRIEGGGDMTRDGEFMGTIEWAAPEQINHGEVTGATDVYALGCVMFACLTARLPYEGDSPAQVLMAHLQDPTPALADRRKDLPAGLQPVLEKAMAKAAPERFQTAGEMMAAAHAASAGEADPLAAVGAKPPKSPAPAGAAPSRGRRTLLIAGPAAAILVVVIVIVALATGGGSTHAASAYEHQVNANDVTLEREVGAVVARDKQGGSLDARIERHIQVRDAIERSAGRLEKLKPPAKVAADHAVLVDGYQLAAQEYADAIKAAQGGDATALRSIDKSFETSSSPAAQQIRRASQRIEARLPGG
jgi:serine/threonine-protein kinase